MKRLLAVAGLIFILATAQAIPVSSLVFVADFALDTELLIEKSGVVLGEEYDPEAIDEIGARLYEYFHDLGEYFVRIPRPQPVPLDDGSLQLVYDIKRFASGTEVEIVFGGLRYISEAKLKEYLGLREGKYELRELSRLFEDVLMLYEKRGHLFAEVGLDSLVLDEGLIAYLGVDEGKPMRIKNYHFSGNKVSKESSLIKATGLLQSSVINQNTLRQAQENLLAKPYIQECVITPLDEENLGIAIKEGKMSYLEGVLGLSEKMGKRELAGLVNIRFLNLWGTDRQIELRWQKTAAELNALELSYHESGFGYFPLEGDLRLSRVAQDSTWIKNQAGVELYFRSLNHKLGLSLASQSVFAGSSHIDLPKDNELSAGLFWKYQNTRGEWSPEAGYEVEGKYSLHKGQRELYHKSEARAGKYSALGQGFVHYVAGEYVASSIKEARDYDLWKLGGYGSLRGYRESEFSATSMALVKNELRYIAGRGSMFYLLADYAAILKPQNLRKYDLAGFGLGLRQDTRLGVISIEYALGIRDKRLQSLALGMIHLGIELSL